MTMARVIFAVSATCAWTMPWHPDGGMTKPNSTPEAEALLSIGQWNLESLFVGPELREFPLASKMGAKVVSMKIDADETRPLKMFLKVVNSIRFRASPGSDLNLHPFQALSVMQGPATRMMGPPAMMEAETAITSALMSVNKWLVREDTLLLVGPTAELSFRRAQTVSDGSASSPNVKSDLFTKMDEIKALKVKLSSQGVNSAEVTQQVAPLIEELKALKQKAGPARFEDVVPMKMPTKEPLPHVFLM